MRVLLVEDDSGIASFVVKGLKQAGFVVEHAAEGRSGLHWLSTQPFDAAIVDLMLPEIESCRIIENLGPGIEMRAIPVIPPAPSLHPVAAESTWVLTAERSRRPGQWGTEGSSFCQAGGVARPVLSSPV